MVNSTLEDVKLKAGAKRGGVAAIRDRGLKGRGDSVLWGWIT